MSEIPIVVYVGTYTGDGGRGVYRFALDPRSGQATVPELAAPSENPSFLALHPRGRFLHAVNELLSAVTTFRYQRARLDPASGLPSPVGGPVPVPRPACLLSLPAAP